MKIVIADQDESSFRSIVNCFGQLYDTEAIGPFANTEDMLNSVKNEWAEGVIVDIGTRNANDDLIRKLKKHARKLF